MTPLEWALHTGQEQVEEAAPLMHVGASVHLLLFLLNGLSHYFVFFDLYLIEFDQETFSFQA